MGVRPPADDTDEPDVIEFGIAALDARLADYEIDYPVETAELRRVLGDMEIPYNAAGNTLRVGDALSEADRREFDDEQELLATLHPIFERKREQTGSSLIAQLRALVPF